MLLLGKPRPIVTKDEEEEWIVAERMRSPTSPRSLGWQFVQEQSCNTNLSYKDAAKASKVESSALSAHRAKLTTLPSSVPGPIVDQPKLAIVETEDGAEMEEELTKPGAKSAKVKSKKQKGKH